MIATPVETYRWSTSSKMVGLKVMDGDVALPGLFTVQLGLSCDINQSVYTEMRRYLTSHVEVVKSGDKFITTLGPWAKLTPEQEVALQLALLAATLPVVA